MIIAIASLKGGVGKTTTALHLATCAAQEGGRVVVVDADEEGSALRWARIGGLPFEVMLGERDRLAQQVKLLVRDGAVVFIDTPPNNREILLRASMLASIIVVPVKPTGLDVDRLVPTLELLRDIEATRGELDVAILLTHWDRRKVLAQEALDALKEFPVLQSKVRDMTRYEQAFGTSPSYLMEYRAVWKELNNG
jgi:chromosome partitioning protein